MELGFTCRWVCGPLVQPGSSGRVYSHRLFVDSILFVSQISSSLDTKSSNRPLLRVLKKHKSPDN